VAEKGVANVTRSCQAVKKVGDFGEKLASGEYAHRSMHRIRSWIIERSAQLTILYS